MDDHDLAPFLQLSCGMALFHSTVEQCVKNTFHPCYMLQGNHVGLEQCLEKYLSNSERMSNSFYYLRSKF